MKLAYLSSIVFVWLLLACEESGVRVTKKDFGDKWPFTVDEGYLDCTGNGEVVFKVGRKRYGLNPEATSSQKYLSVDAIWKDDPKMKGTKIVLFPIVQRGQQICK